MRLNFGEAIEPFRLYVLFFFCMYTSDIFNLFFVVSEGLFSLFIFFGFKSGFNENI